GRADLLVYASLAGLALALVGTVTSSEPLPCMIAVGLVGGLPAGVFASLPGESLRAEMRATGMGIFYTIFYAGTALAPAVAGVISVRSGSSAAPIWFAVACVAATALSLAIARRVQKAAVR